MWWAAWSTMALDPGKERWADHRREAKPARCAAGLKIKSWERRFKGHLERDNCQSGT